MAYILVLDIGIITCLDLPHVHIFFALLAFAGSVPTGVRSVAFKNNLAPTVKNIHLEVFDLDANTCRVEHIVNTVTVRCKGRWNKQLLHGDLYIVGGAATTGGIGHCNRINGGLCRRGCGLGRSG